MNTTTAERKAGKLERIRLLLDNIRAKQPKSMVDKWSDAVTLPRPLRNITPLITLPTDKLLEELEANLDDIERNSVSLLS